MASTHYVAKNKITHLLCIIAEPHGPQEKNTMEIGKKNGKWISCNDLGLNWINNNDLGLRGEMYAFHTAARSNM